jgi:hypothetical protein
MYNQDDLQIIIDALLSDLRAKNSKIKELEAETDTMREWRKRELEGLNNLAKKIEFSETEILKMGGWSSEEAERIKNLLNTKDIDF